MSFDGCTSQKVPDTDRNQAWLGKDQKAGHPRLELMTLVETGHPGHARLVLWDRGFDANDFLTAAAKTGAQFLGRCRASRRPPVLTRLRDGSYLSRIGTLIVRIIEAVVTVTCADGTTYTGTYRLVTSLLDARRYPASALISLYHERWEHESTYLALRHTLLDGRILRSRDPAGLC